MLLHGEHLTVQVATWTASAFNISGHLTNSGITVFRLISDACIQNADVEQHNKCITNELDFCL